MRLTLRALLLGLGITLCLPTLLIAQDDPNPGPLMSFEITGIVTAFAPSFGAISIDGEEFLIAEGVNLQSLDGGDPLEALKVGSEIGYVANEDENGRFIVVEIWVLSTPISAKPGDDN